MTVAGGIAVSTLAAILGSGFYFIWRELKISEQLVDDLFDDPWPWMVMAADTRNSGGQDAQRAPADEQATSRTHCDGDL